MDYLHCDLRPYSEISPQHSRPLKLEVQHFFIKSEFLGCLFPLLIQINREILHRVDMVANLVAASEIVIVQERGGRQVFESEVREQIADLFEGRTI